MPDDPIQVLQDKITGQKKTELIRSSNSRPSTPPSNFRAGGELVGAIMGGILLGYLADKMFVSQPYGLVLGALLGIIAGFYGVWRASR